MTSIGVIAEYNPFHNGHLYQLEKIREMEPDALIIAVITTTFTQRGTPSILSKYDKTRICLEYGIDLVVELPYPFATQGADIFAKGAIQILTELKVDKLYFGSESNDVSNLIHLAKITFSDDYQKKVSFYLNNGINYPTALNLAFENENTVTTPNDLLGLSYVKEILRQNSKIVPKTIKRTNSYHEKKILSEITSATSIREAIKLGLDFSKAVPPFCYQILKNVNHNEEAYFSLLRYKIISCPNLSIYQTVDEGIENRIKKEIRDASSLEDLVQRLKTKRYTYNRIKRMLCHILCCFTKEEAKKFSDISYIRILGFSLKGRNYLNGIKKNVSIPMITTLSKGKNEMLDLEKRIFSIYSSIYPVYQWKKLEKKEYQDFPIFIDKQKRKV